MKEAYYKASGKFSASFFLHFIWMSLLAIPVLSIAYIYLVHYIPAVYFNVIIAAICGALLGLVMKYALTWGKVRNRALAFGFGLIAVCVLKYVQWCVYIPLVFSNVYQVYELNFLDRFWFSVELLITPSAIFEFARFINEEGVWSIRSLEVKGVALLVVWVLEFITLLISAFFTFADKCKAPFCEKENKWYIEMPGKIEISPPENFDAVKTDMENGNFSELIRLAKEPKKDASQFWSLSFYMSPSSERHYLKVEETTITSNKGKEKKDETVLLEYLSIDNTSVSEIQAAQAQIAQENNIEQQA